MGTECLNQIEHQLSNHSTPNYRHKRFETLKKTNKWIHTISKLYSSAANQGFILFYYRDPLYIIFLHGKKKERKKESRCTLRENKRRKRGQRRGSLYNSNLYG
ncbi:hypothetical protein Droror1_Dr00010018 [Drosera rotundifolia]